MMDDSLYLTNIRLTQFRSFAKLDIDLPAEPSVLIVHGSNGLGKSSLFDALEWTLTDRIDHYRDVNGVKKVGKYLCRWREGDDGPTSAAMTFCDGSSIERMLSSADATQSTRGGNIEDIGAFLKAPTWDQTIQSLQHYLMLTHFLGQSALSRLTHRTPAERFDILKEAAQSREIEQLAITLHGKGNTTASKAFTRRIDHLEKEVGRLDELLAQEAELWEGTLAAGALDPTGAATLGRTILVEIDAARAELALVPMARQATDAMDHSELTAIWDDAQAQVRDREAQLRRAGQLIEGWGAARRYWPRPGRRSKKLKPSGFNWLPDCSNSRPPASSSSGPRPRLLRFRPPLLRASICSVLCAPQSTTIASNAIQWRKL